MKALTENHLKALESLITMVRYICNLWLMGLHWDRNFQNYIVKRYSKYIDYTKLYSNPSKWSWRSYIFTKKFVQVNIDLFDN